MQYGWIPEVPDRRDLRYGREIKPTIPLPDTIDLREHCSPVEDQRSIGACVAFALAGNIEYDDRAGDDRWTDISHLFIYYNARAVQGNTMYDTGSTLRDGIKSLVKLGVCTETMWPYDTSKYRHRPPIWCYVTGMRRRIVSYYKLTTLNDMLTCLASGYPFVQASPYMTASNPQR
jgi:C1A family cysteine protease